MNLVVISYPKVLPEEDKVITLLFENGMEYFHLRKPDSSFDQIENLLKKIPNKYHRQIILHGNWSLMDKYNLGGVHIREKDKSSVSDVGQLHSIAIHNFDELYQIKGNFKYMLLSPIFDSISKEATKSQFDLQDIKSKFTSGKPKQAVYALGGINAKNLKAIKNSGFDGAAILGYLWKDYKLEEAQLVVDKFKSIQELCQ